VIRAGQKRRVEGFLARGESEGAPVIAQGQVAEGAPAEGFYVAPTLAYARRCRATAARLRRGVRPGAVRDALRGRGRRGRARQRHATSAWSPASGRATAGALLRCRAPVRAGQVFVNGYGAGGGVELPFGGIEASPATGARRASRRFTKWRR
jgi:aldehyde dehydrogenase (NAD+)